jgi:hypothetical protein
MQITVRYLAVDGFSKTRRFKTLAGAQKFAQHYLGEHPEFYERSWYAVSFDGVGRVTVEGATLADLFPPKVEEPPANLVYDQVEGWVEDGRVDPYPVYEDARSIIPGPKVDTWPDDCPF